MPSKTSRSTAEPIKSNTAKAQRTSLAVARAARRGDHKGEADARRAHAETTIEVAIEKALASAPPLTTAQLKRLSTLLRSGGAK